MKALVGAESGGYQLAEHVEVPSPKPGTILCRVYAVGLNPYDAKRVDYSNAPGTVGGCDFAGVVVEAGPGIERFKVGDRVLAVTFGLNATDKTAGAFAEYALANEWLSCHLPDGLSFEQAASMGLAIATAGLATFAAPGLALDMSRINMAGQEAKIFVLVSGGATGTGTMATQLLKLAGYDPIVTCSPENNALCQSYGAEACFDYTLSTCGADIRVYTADSLTYVLDCVTDASTMNMCYQALGSSGGHYVATEDVDTVVKYTRRDVRADWLMAPTMVGSSLEMDGAYGRPSTPEHKWFASRLFSVVGRLLQEGSLMHHPIHCCEGGLASIPTWLDHLRMGNVRAKRLIVPLLDGQIEP
ncbi:alcohol dehydrogenase [Teratosphaeria destructans]|uniref:Alcohol dehydrogenase n=1 Tax=Teratosphaeria destructans TaxID=418781 RepID=A0A9W7SJG7_9PEZI|nr:alcohol dehydrogenase [Teratosphaeria destructans]